MRLVRTSQSLLEMIFPDGGIKLRQRMRKARTGEIRNRILYSSYSVGATTLGSKHAKSAACARSRDRVTY